LKESKTFRDVVLASQVRAELEGIVLEWKHSGRLRDFGISPRSKLLLHGPPGCGKSLTAQALGNELGIPVYMVRFDAVIGAFLGQTAINLRQLFHFAETTPCVLLLDELDALGKKRGNPLDVGELDRIVISLMQELEHTKPMGVIVGTTNLPKHLDDALWRRFDLDLQLKAPTQSVLKAYAKKIATSNGTAISMRALSHASQSSSFAAAEKIVIAEIRRKVLEDVREK
jgi:SpoVK/Ycf46/Vps4 family AAA+-type ATPase